MKRINMKTPLLLLCAALLSFTNFAVKAGQAATPVVDAITLAGF